MDDKEFLYVSKLIFKYRGTNQSVHTEFDNISQIDINNEELKTKYFNNNKLYLNMNSVDSGVIIDLLNYYEPNLDLTFSINNEEENLIIRRFNAKTQFDVNYEIMDDIVFHLNNIHGGNIFIKGDVYSTGLLNLIESSKPELTMRTNITIRGSLRGDIELFFDKLNSIIHKIIQNNDDDNMFSMNINVLGKISHDSIPNNDLELIKITNIRCWEIKYETNEDVHKFSVQKKN